MLFINRIVALYIFATLGLGQWWTGWRLLCSLIVGSLNMLNACHRFNIYWHCLGDMTRIWVPQTRYALRRNTASRMNSLVWLMWSYWKGSSNWSLGKSSNGFIPAVV